LRKGADHQFSGSVGIDVMARDREPCVLSEIVVGRAPARIIYEEERPLAILTIGPVNPGHTLILAKQHAPYLDDLNNQLVTSSIV
jgi:histidine triad (HIT) family protein